MGIKEKRKSYQRNRKSQKRNRRYKEPNGNHRSESIIPKIIDSVDGFNSRMQGTEERISGLEYKQEKLPNLNEGDKIL